MNEIKIDQNNTAIFIIDVKLNFIIHNTSTNIEYPKD